VSTRRQRHADLPSLEAQIDVEKKEIENRRDDDIEASAKKLEEDIAEARERRRQGRRQAQGP
jgi:DNA-directed RNA polymerase subunit beta'